MALIKCPECGREEVSDSAENCPNCGYGIKLYFDKITKEEEIKRKEDAENIKRMEMQKRNAERLLLEKNKELKRVEDERLPSKPRFFAELGGITIAVVIFLVLFALYGTSQVLQGEAEEGASFYLVMLYLAIIGIIIFKVNQYNNKMIKYHNFVEHFDIYKQNKIRDINEKYGSQHNSYTEIKTLPKVQVPNIKISTNEVKCPRCGSTNIQIVKRGWKLTTGFIGSSKNERVCVSCMKKF